MLVCFIVLLTAAFVINPGWTTSLTKEFIAFVKGNWASYRSKKED